MSCATLAGIGALSSQQPLIVWAGVLLFYVHRSQPCSMRLVCSDTDGAGWDVENELVVYATEESHREMQSKGDYSSFFDSAEGMPRPRPRPSLPAALSTTLLRLTFFRQGLIQA